MTVLNVPQARFLTLDRKYRALVAGFGTGKTWAGCAGLCKHFYEFPRIDAGYFAPTYAQIRDIFYPTIEEVADSWGMDVVIHESNKEVSIYRSGLYYGKVICRSMDKPSTIVGFKIGHALVDEIDLMPKKKAQHAWRKIIARMRYKVDGLRNGVDVTTTPEGFNFVYDQFVRLPSVNPELAALYGYVQASTYENAKNLNADYISALKASYPANLIEAYLHGKFVNLTQGTIYHSFDRKLNASTEKIRGDETIYVGMDFNVGKMAAIVHVMRDGLPHAVEEIIDSYDTPDMIEKIKDRYWEYDEDEKRWYRTRQIRIYPDSSGGSRDTANASESDIQLLTAAGFKVCAPSANPPVRNRINAMNAMFHNAAGERRYKVNIKACPRYTECLEQQAYNDAGEPDKAGGHDHANDAGGYFINYDFPIYKPKIETINVRV